MSFNSPQTMHEREDAHETTQIEVINTSNPQGESSSVTEKAVKTNQPNAHDSESEEEYIMLDNSFKKSKRNTNRNNHKSSNNFSNTSVSSCSAHTKNKSSASQSNLNSSASLSVNKRNGTNTSKK